MAELSGGRVEAAVDRLISGSVGLEDSERAAILEHAASAADEHGLAPRAEQVRRLIIEEIRGAPELPAAMLALARALASRPEGYLEAQGLLERLVVEHPRSALAPQARRELQELRRRIPSS